MTAFISIAVALVAVALGWILPPLLRRRATTDGVARASLNLDLLRDQLIELDADLANGTLSAEQHAQAKLELDRRVLEDTAAAETPVSIARGGRLTALAVAIVVPVAAGLLYYELGNLDALEPGAASMAGGEHQLTPHEIAGMVEKLAARLEKNPDDAEGWGLLARSYYSMQRFPEAIAAYEKAAALSKGDANLLADYADALAMSAGRKIEGKPLELVNEALKIDPNHWKALAMAGTAAFDRKDYKQAVRYWERVQAALPPDSELAQSMSASIAEARALGGIKGPPAAAAPAASPIAAASGGSVQGMVTLGSGFAAKVAPDDTVFVFARAAEGPKMPLAIFKSQVRDLPLKFKLDDSMAMAPKMNISSFPQIVVGARVSKSGGATPQSGDLQGFSKPVKVGTANVAVVIDSAVP